LLSYSDEDACGLTFQEWNPARAVDKSQEPVPMIINSSQMRAAGSSSIKLSRTGEGSSGGRKRGVVYAPAIGGRSLSRSLSRGLSSSSASSAGSDAFAFVSDDDDTGAGNGNGAGH
jgi:hypothetical protein